MAAASLARLDPRADPARWLHRLAERRHRTVDLQQPAQQEPPAPGEGAAAEATLTAVPGIGSHYARALLERFGSIDAVVAATEAELRDVPGIGPARARALRSALGGDEV